QTVSVPTPPPGRAPGGLELVNFRDPSQRSTGELKGAEAPPVVAPAAEGSGKGVWIGSGLAAALIIGAGIFILMRSHPAAVQEQPKEAPAPVATAPIVFPAPQVGKDSVKESRSVKPAPKEA